MPARSFPLAVPRLVGRLRLQDIPDLSSATGEAVRKAWDDAMFELQRFLESLQVSADVTQDTLTEIEDTIASSGGELTARRPTPHMHIPSDVATLSNDTDLLLSTQAYGI